MVVILKCLHARYFKEDLTIFYAILEQIPYILGIMYNVIGHMKNGSSQIGFWSKRKFLGIKIEIRYH